MGNLATNRSFDFGADPVPIFLHNFIPSIYSRYVIGLISWADMTRYGLFVLKVLLNSNRSTSTLRMETIL